MDDRRFDHLTRRLGVRPDRRSVLGRAAIALAGGAAAGLATTDARATRATCRAVGASCVRDAQCCTDSCQTARSTPRARRNRCGTCPPTRVPCGETCCAVGEACIAGACRAACTPGVDGVSGCIYSMSSVTPYTSCWSITGGGPPCASDEECLDREYSVRFSHVGCYIGVSTTESPLYREGAYCATWEGDGSCLQ